MDKPGYIMDKAIETAQAHVPDVIDTTIGSLQHAIELIESAGYRISRIADRIVGTGPTPMPIDKNPRPSEPPIEILMGDLGRAVEHLFTQLDRLAQR